MQIAERIHRGRNAIAMARQRKEDTSQWERHLVMLLAEAGREPEAEKGIEPWMLWEWRRVSIPDWRGILGEAIESEDEKREEYARWMLRDILLDPEYKEPQD